MPEQTDPATAGPGRGTATPPPLPDLTGVDLRSLPDLDDPALLAAVDHVLRHPPEAGEGWCTTGTGDSHEDTGAPGAEKRG